MIENESKFDRSEQEELARIVNRLEQQGKIEEVLLSKEVEDKLLSATDSVAASIWARGFKDGVIVATIVFSLICITLWWLV